MKRSVVTFDLQGGLGNQLFQLAALNYYARKNSLEAVARVDRIKFGSTERHFGLSESICRDLFAPVPFEISRSVLAKNLVKIRAYINAKYPSARFLHEYRAIGIGYDDGLEVIDCNRLDGYFQTYKYVENLTWKQIIRNSLYRESAFQKFQQLCETVDPIVLHIRGGDYLQDQSGIGNLSRDYFHRALKQAGERGERVYVFTDDLTYARGVLLDLPFNFQFIDQDHLLSAFDTMLLISCGKRIVISNSTFAWWGAYFSIDSKIYAPSKWFRKISDPLELCPENWHRVLSEWLD